MWCPAAARRSAHARPMPRLAPVISVVRFDLVMALDCRLSRGSGYRTQASCLAVRCRLPSSMEANRIPGDVQAWRNGQGVFRRRSVGAEAVRALPLYQEISAVIAEISW